MRGLQQWLPCNEAHGSHLNDISGYGNHGVITGYADSMWSGDARGPALKFDGSTNYASFAPRTITDEFTVSFWVYIDVVETATLIGASSHQYDYFFLMQSNKFYLRTKATFESTSVIAPQFDNGWHHFLVERNSAYKINFEADGVVRLAGVSTRLGDIEIDSIGAEIGTASHFDGSMRDLRIYDRLLTRAEKSILFRGDLTPLRRLDPPVWAFGVGGAPEPSTDVFFDNRIDEISQGSRIQTAAKLGGVLVE